MLGKVKLAILEHLAAIAIEQKQRVRRTRKRFERGWTSYNDLGTTLGQRRTLTLLTMCGSDDSLVDLRYDDERWSARISRKGVEALEQHLGREIFA